MTTNDQERIAVIIEAAAAKGSGGFSTGIPTLAHREAAEKIVDEIVNVRVAELERANDNLLRALGAVVRRFGGVVKISRGAMLDDYMVHETEDPTTGGIRIKSEVYVPCKNDRRAEGGLGEYEMDQATTLFAFQPCMDNCDH